MIRVWPRAAALLLPFLTCTAALAHAALPDWLQDCLAAPTPSSASDASSYQLLDEQWVSIRPAGRITTIRRGAVRILSRAGQDHAQCSVTYLRGSSEVKDIRAWLISPDGRTERQGRAQAIDLGLAGTGTLYSDARRLSLTAEHPPVGSVFAWQFEIAEEPLLSKWEWAFDGDCPVRLSRLSISLPVGLTPHVEAFEAEGMTSSQSGSTWTWERRDVPARLIEPMMVRGWRTRSGLDIEVRGADRLTAAGRSLRDWAEVSSWLDQLASGQAEVTPAIRARAERVTAGLVDTLAQIEALARDVQRLNYVAVALGLGRGQGYRPHSATEVLATGYGDCKDKANLLCALLHARGIDAWLMPVYWGEREHVDPAWPSPAQFNHCIVAVRAPGRTRTPTEFQHPLLGSLIAFDATDALTTFGDLPQSQQGSLALLVDSHSGGLVRLPVIGPPGNQMIRRVEAALGSDGALSGHLSETSTGQMAVRERQMWRHDSASEYLRRIESWLSSNALGVRVSHLVASEDTLRGTFQLTLDFDSPAFARLLQGRLLAFRPTLTSSRIVLPAPDSARVADIALDASCVSESVFVRLPVDFLVDDLPVTVDRVSDFGQMHADWRVEGDQLRVNRRWIVSPGRIPSARHAEVRSLFEAVAATTQASVVLKRRP